jgi:eukaryotic-like serine/threonine-protein kinase
MEDHDDRPTEAMAVVHAGDDTTHTTVREDDARFESIASSGEDLPARLPIGTVLSGYRIERMLGKGAMGVVYGATHPVIGKRVAIKVLRGELCSNPAAVQRFVGEARAVNAIGHPNIIDIFDLGELPDGRQYLVMELLEGETLRARIKRGKLDVAEAASIIASVASALRAAHAKGIVHRDIKPDNIFLPEQRRDIKLLDFGLAKLTLDLGAKTQTGAVIGTPRYMSPEQARGKDVDQRADIYALGAMAFELLANRIPFERSSTFDLLMAHVNEPVPALHPLAPHAPVELCQLVEAMLAKSPDDRPTLDAIRRVIKRVRTQLPGGLDRTDPPLTSSSVVTAPRPDLEATRLDKPASPVDDTEPDQHAFEDTGGPTHVLVETFQRHPQHPPPRPSHPPTPPPPLPSIDPMAPTTPHRYEGMPYHMAPAPSTVNTRQLQPPRWLLIALVAAAVTALGIALALIV